jgi:hypothetical protein
VISTPPSLRLETSRPSSDHPPLSSRHQSQVRQVMFATRARFGMSLNQVREVTTILAFQSPVGTMCTTFKTVYTVYPCVPYGPHNKQRLSPKTALAGWSL